MGKLKLVPDWRKALGWLSVQIPLLNVAFISVWAQLPPKFQDALPAQYVLVIAVALIFVGVLGRMIDQGGVNADGSPK